MTQTQHPTDDELAAGPSGPERVWPDRRWSTGETIDLEDFPGSDGFDELDRDDPSWTDPRFLVPLTLFLAAVFVIGLALRANQRLDEAPPPIDRLVLEVSEAQARAGFEGIGVRRDGELIVLEGQAQTAADAAAIGAVARSVDGVAAVDNRIVIAGGATAAAPASSVTPAPATDSSLANRLAAAGNITFEPASAAITPEGLAIVDAVAAILAGAPEIPLEVHGHTDSDGDSVVNERLSQERAQAVVDALVERGVAAERLTPVGFGESDPIAPNITAEGRAENRRIEFALRP